VRYTGHGIIVLTRQVPVRLTRIRNAWRVTQLDDARVEDEVR